MLLTDAGIAQSVEHFTRNEGVEGSSPFSSLTEKARKYAKTKERASCERVLFLIID